MKTIWMALMALSAVSVPALAQQKVPVQFARGTSSSTIKGTIKGDQYRDYTVNAREGQTLSVTLANPDGRAFFNVLPPGSNDVAVFVGSTSGNSFRGPVPGTGNTTIRVYQMRATARRGETASYTLTVGVTGSAAAGASGRPNDALVPGTGFNATGPLRCVAEPNKPMVNCQAGVKRTGYDGSGTVTITTPDGGSRTITFANGRAVRSDAQAGMTAERRGDMTIVRIGTVEVYEIPDMFIYGG